MIPIPWWARFAISLAWKAARSALVKAGVEQSVITKIEQILQFLGLLNSDSVHSSRVDQVHSQCSGVACAPELKV